MGCLDAVMDAVQDRHLSDKDAHSFESKRVCFYEMDGIVMSDSGSLSPLWQHPTLLAMITGG